MKKLIHIAFLIFSIQLQSSPMAPQIQLAGQIELSHIQYDVLLNAELKTEKARSIQYEGTALLSSSESGEQERPITLYLTKSQSPRIIVSILMSGSRNAEGLYIELVAEKAIQKSALGDVIVFDAELMWMIKDTFITRDRGYSELEVLSF